MVTREGVTGICPQLEGVVGSVDGRQRWQRFLEAGSRTAAEFSWCWTTLQKEASQISDYLGKELVGALADPGTICG